MSFQSPGPYPGLPQYPQSSGFPEYGPNGKPPRPKQVMWAHYCMLGGAALSVISGAVGFMEENTIRNAIATAFPDYDASKVDSVATIAVIAGLVAGLVQAGLWIWMAFATKAGRNWARILSTVFFGIGVLGALGGGVRFFAFSSSNGQTSSATTTSVTSTSLAWAGTVLGLLAIIFLWQGASKAFFSKQPPGFGPQASYGYGPGFPPGYGPQQDAGQQGWGQQPPYPQQQYPARQPPPQPPQDGGPFG